MDIVIELREKYGKVRKFLEEEWKKDPETEPYRSKYKAMEYLKEMKDILVDAIDKASESENIQYLGMLAVVLLQQGIIALDTEELSAGDKYLNEALKNIVDSKDPRFVLVALTCRNQLGILWSQLSEIETAQKWLEECEELYKSFLESGRADAAMSLNEHFESSKEAIGAQGCDEIEKVHTLTKFYLAQVYGKLGETMKSAIYCHETLRRQLECKQYDPVDWALNSATLSQFFMEQKLYKQARHHLAGASFMLDRHEEALKSLDIGEEEMEAKKEELRHRGADVSRCWAKYGIYILEQSKNGLTGNDVEIEELGPRNLQNLWFTTLELSEYENQMTDTLVVDFDAARDLLLVTQRYLMSAKEYYSLEDHASDYVQIIQDHSSLLRHLSGFENDHTRLCKMLRKRINMVEDVIKELNPQYYLNVCRALWFELGESYHDLMHMKQAKIRESSELPNPAALGKINHLAELSILNFQHFLESVKNKQTHELPETLPDDLLRPILVAHFFLGRLYYKLVTPDKRQVLKNTNEALQCFKYVVDYCSANAKAALIVSDELSISQEMASLLHLKVKQMMNVVAWMNNVVNVKID